MSSPWAPELVAAMRNLARRRPVTLVEIYFADAPGGAATLRGGNGDVILPDGRVFESGIRCNPIRSTIAWLGGGPSPSSCSFRVANRKWAVLGGLTTFQSLPTWRWKGASVTIYLWERSLTSAAHLGQYFAGRIDSAPLGDEQLLVNVIQHQSWNVPLPPETIDVVSEPNATDGALGQTKPIVIGDWKDYAMRPPHADPYSGKSLQQDSGAGRGVVPLMLVDPGVGAAKVKLLAASHACLDLLNRAAGYSIYVAAGDVLAPLDTTGITETLGGAEAFVEIDDDQMIAYYGVRPVDVRTSQNTATNPRRAMDPFDESSFASLDQAAGDGVLELQLPSGGGHGRIEAVDVVLVYRGDPANTHNIRVRPYNPATADAGSALTQAATSTTPSSLVGALDSAWWTQNWDFGGITGSVSPNRQTIDLRVDFTGGTANVADVFWVGLRVKYRPGRTVVTPGSTPPRFLPRLPGGGYGVPLGVPIQVEQPTFRVDGQFFANVKGAKDNGSGDFTGIAGGIIQLPPDIARWLLTTYGSATSFETAYDPTDPSIGFGSVVRARYTLGRGFPGGARLACWIGGTQTSMQDVLRKIGEQSLSCILLDPFTGKWLFHPWLAGAPADYDLELGLEDLPDLFEPDDTSDVELLQGQRVQYAFDHFRGRTTFETFIAPESSSMGYSLPQWRDQKPIVIDATNDKIDLQHATGGGGVVAATLAHATYTDPHTLAAEAESKLAAALAGAGVTNRQWRVWHGWNVKASMVNFAIEYINNTGGTYDGSAGCAIEAKDYGTPELVAAAVTQALNDMQVVATIDGSGTTAVLVFYVSYDHQTNKFTIECNYHFRIKVTVVGGTSYQIADGWLLLGWNALFVASARLGAYGSPDPTNGLPGTPITCRTPMYAERYRVMTYHNGSSATSGIANALLWGTGANAATCCALELGWDKTDAVMPTSGIDQGLYGQYPRNMREVVADESRAAYGPKETGLLVADWVPDEQTAILLRNARFDFTCTPKTKLRARTWVCPDLQRMRVITFRASLDQKGKPYPKFGSDGSWAGKRMRVIEGEYEIDTSYHVDFRAVEA